MPTGINMDKIILDQVMEMRAMIGNIIDIDEELDVVVKVHLQVAWESLDKILGWTAQ